MEVRSLPAALRAMAVTPLAPQGRTAETEVAPPLVTVPSLTAPSYTSALTQSGNNAESTLTLNWIVWPAAKIGPPTTVTVTAGPQVANPR